VKLAAHDACFPAGLLVF